MSSPRHEQPAVNLKSEGKVFRWSNTHQKPPVTADCTAGHQRLSRRWRCKLCCDHTYPLLLPLPTGCGARELQQEVWNAEVNKSASEKSASSLPPPVDAHVGGAREPGVQNVDAAQGVRTPDGVRQSRVVVQSQPLSEPVDGVDHHRWGSALCSLMEMREKLPQNKITELLTEAY